jgi:Recombination endonuclease VII
LCGVNQGALNKALDVDHCHKSNQIRGLLCNHCNRAIGLAKEDPALLRKMANYVEKEQAFQPRTCDPLEYIKAAYGDKWGGERLSSVEFFIKAFGLRPGSKGGGQRVPVRVLYNNYLHWGKESFIDALLGLQAFGRELSCLGYQRQGIRSIAYRWVIEDSPPKLNLELPSAFPRGYNPNAKLPLEGAPNEQARTGSLPTWGGMERRRFLLPQMCNGGMGAVQERIPD